jgi:Ca-activated chloride channel family protein
MSKTHTPKVEVFPLKEKALAEGPSEMDFLIRITAPEIEIEKNRPRLNLGLVLDRSGSMSGRKLKNSKRAACYCVDQLMSTDRVSVTVFDNRVDVICPTTLVQDRTDIKENIKRVTSGGTTALHAAWVHGSRQVAECLDPTCLNRVILMTDGLANEGETDTATIANQARVVYEKGISTSTIGVGQDFNEDLLVPMAQAAGGNSWFVEGPEDFQRIFETEMEGLLREVCTRVSLGIDPESGVEILDVLNDFHLFKNGKYSLPNLLSGEPLDIVVRAKLPGGEEGKARVFEVTVGWSPQGYTARLYAEKQAAITYAPEEKVQLQEVNLEVQKAIQLLESARAKRKSMEYMDRGDFHSASEILNSLSLSSRELAYVMGDMDLDADSEELAELSRSVREKRDLLLSRKKMAYQSSQRQRGRKEKKDDTSDQS